MGFASLLGTIKELFLWFPSYKTHARLLCFAFGFFGHWPLAQAGLRYPFGQQHVTPGKQKNLPATDGAGQQDFG